MKKKILFFTTLNAKQTKPSLASTHLRPKKQKVFETYAKHLIQDGMIKNPLSCYCPFNTEVQPLLVMKAYRKQPAPSCWLYCIQTTVLVQDRKNLYFTIKAHVIVTFLKFTLSLRYFNDASTEYPRSFISLVIRIA